MPEAVISKARVAKVDEGLGLVFGYGIICKEGGRDYYDSQGDHIPEDVMLKSVTDFMRNARVAKDMHTGEQIGAVVHSFPMTEDIAKFYGMKVDKTGWMIAFQPDDPAVLEKFKTGERSGFSIGGKCSYTLEGE